MTKRDPCVMTEYPKAAVSLHRCWAWSSTVALVEDMVVVVVAVVVDVVDTMLVAVIAGVVEFVSVVRPAVLPVAVIDDMGLVVKAVVVDVTATGIRGS